MVKIGKIIIGDSSMIANDTVIFRRLTDIREDMDISQLEMAKKLGVSQATYSRWETGKEIIPLVKLNEYCNYTNHSMDYICGLIPIEKSNIKIVSSLDRVLIGSRLQIFRMQFGLFQHQLAQFLNTTQSTISAYESGKTLILTAFVYQIAKEYQISMDFLCGRDEKKTF